MSQQLKNKVCLVTGASRGIGRAIALALSEQGGTVFGTATTSQGAERISDYLATGQKTGRGLVLDVTDDNSVNQTVEAVSKSGDGPVVLVNNAGITRDNLLLRMKDEEWNETIDTDLKSVFRMSKACLRGMIKARYGRIINISSVVGLVGNAGQSNYAAAKAGMVGFSRSLAQEVASRNITVNVVAPGFVDSDMTGALSDSQRETLLQRIPLGRMGSPEEIAHTVVFLASPMSGYITGSTIHVNGGMAMI